MQIILGFEVKIGTKELIVSIKNTRLQINKLKTKYIVISRRDNHGEYIYLEVGSYTF